MFTFEYLLGNLSHGILELDDFQAVLRANRETKTTQENIKDLLQLDDGDLNINFLFFHSF
jgi:hypothetical protein